MPKRKAKKAKRLRQQMQAYQFGRLGAASGVRHIDPTGYVPAEAKGASPSPPAPVVVRLEKRADRLLAQKPKRIQRPFRRPWRDPMAQAFKRAMADPDA